MFARVKRRRSPREHSGIGELAAYILTPSKSAQVGIEPFSPPKPSKIGADEVFSTAANSRTTEESYDSRSKHQLSQFEKTGGKSSYHLSDHDDLYIDRKAARRGYRVVSYKTTKSGKRKVFDILDGKTYHCGTGVQRRITDNAITFATKQEALSERFPSNQVNYHREINTKINSWSIL